MPKAVGRKTAGRRRKRAADGAVQAKMPAGATSSRRVRTGRLLASEARVEAIMKAAERSGLLNKKSSRIGGRVSAELVMQAKKQTGLQADTDLIEFALANVALEDKFAGAFKASRGKVDEDLKLGF
ncbi:MAG TPA: hypothetical protein VEI03_15295 [Stellaceae bacterium]|nr:hypothetical protein [Stellaceae bacterium]